MRTAPGRFPLLLPLFVIAASCEGQVGPTINENPTIEVPDITVSTAEDTLASGSVTVSGSTRIVTAYLAQQAAHGTVTFTSATEFDYVPAPNYTGPDTATVTASDGVSQATATVNIVVTPVNDKPSLPAGTVVPVNEDSSVLLSADNLGIIDPDTALPSITVTLVASSAFLSSGNRVQPFPNFNGDLPVSVLLDDGSGAVTADLVVRVAPVNDPPVLTLPTAQATDENTPFSFAGAALVGVTDIDSPTLSLTLSADSGTFSLSSTSGLTFTSGDGTDDSAVEVSGTPAAINFALNGFTVTPPADFTGLVTLSVAADDHGALGTVSDSFVLGVAAVDLPPRVTLPASLAANEDVSLTLTAALAIAVDDPDAQPTDTIDVVLTVSHGTVNGQRRLVLTDTAAAINADLDGVVYRADADFNGDDTLVAEVTSNGASDIKAASIVVQPVNDAPTITGPTLLATTSGSVTLTGPNALAFADVDAGSAVVRLTIDGPVLQLAPGNAAPVTVEAVSPTEVILDGTIDDLNAALADSTISSGVGRLDFVFTLDDQGNTGAGGSLTATLDLSVNFTTPNSPPVASPDDYSTSGNVSVEIAAPGVLANDSDVDGPVTARLIVPPALGTLSFIADGSFSYAPSVGVGNVVDEFVYAAVDNSGAETVAVATIVIGDVFWFVDPLATDPPDGSLGAPFTTIAAASAVAQSGSTIYVKAPGATSIAGANIPAGVKLLGSVAPLVLSPQVTLAAAGRPIIDSTSSTIVTSGGAVTGFAFQGGSGSALGVTGEATLSDLQFANVHTAITIASASGTVRADTITINTAGVAAISLIFDQPATIDLTNVQVTDAATAVLANFEPGGDATLNITNLTATTMSSTGIFVRNDGSHAIVAIRNSNLDNGGSGSPLGDQALSFSASTGETDLLFAGNNVRGYGTFGVDIRTSGATAAMNANIHDNTFAGDVPGSFSGGTVIAQSTSNGPEVDVYLHANQFQNVAGDGIFLMSVVGGTLCADLQDNVATGNPTGYHLINNGGPFLLPGYDGASVANSLAARNNQGPSIVSGTVADGACEPPAIP